MQVAIRVSAVQGSQRPDATRLVDIDYTLTGSQPSYSIMVEVSDDGGTTWDITATAVYGDVGAGVAPGTDKHIAWNPAADIPGVSGSNFKVRVIADGVYYADSNVFSIVAAGPGDLLGTVRDQASGQPIVGATVTVTGQSPGQTGSLGEFAFTDVQAGQATLGVTAAGYCGITETVSMREDSATTVNVLLMPNAGFGVCEVRGQYCGPGRHAYYLDSIWLPETFTATIDWDNHPPGKVRWIKSNDPSHPIEDTCSGPAVSRGFDMGADFGAGGTLSVVAVTGDNPPVESSAYVVNFKVIPPPPIVDLLSTANYWAVPEGQTFSYQIALLTDTTVDLAAWDGSEVASDFPLFGGADMKLGMVFGKDPGAATGSLSGKVTPDGEAELFTVGWSDSVYKKVIRKGVHCRKGIKLPFIEVSPEVSWSMSFYWSAADAQWHPGGEVDLGCLVQYVSPQVPVGAILFIPVTARLESDFDVALQLGVDGWTEAGPQYFGSTAYELITKLVVGVGLKDWLCVEVYGGGGFHAVLAFVPNVEWQHVYIILVGGIRADIGPFLHPEVGIRWTYPDDERSLVPSLNAIMRDTQWTLLPRDYLKYREGADAGRGGPAVQGCRAPTLLRGGFEAPIEEAVFPYSTPAVTSAGNEVLAVWIADNTRRDLINRTELRFATYDGAAWSSAVAVAGDGTGDLNPRLVSLPNGDAAVIWQDANAVLSDTDPFDVFLSHLEIAVALYDGDAGTWSASARLTNDGTLDRSPNIAAASANDMLAVWVSNAANDLWGSAGAPNTIRWSRWNGMAWDPPAEMATGLGTVLDTTLAYDGTTGTFVFVTDADDNLDTPEDQELWAATCTGGVWSAPVRLTNDAICDAAPRLAYDGSGVLRLVWLKGDDIEFATGTDVGNAQVVVTPGESMGSKDFKLVTSPTGRIALVWNDTSATYHDLWVSYFEPTQNAWSQPRQLTFDDYAERFISGTFDGNDDLLCVYDKTQTVYVDREEWVNGQLVVVEGVPEAGQSDLYYLSYHLAGDLAVAVEDVNADPPNPLPGTQTTIAAKIKNVGESPASNIEVGFYDGDPDAGGVLIDVLQLIAGPLVGGSEAQVSVTWTVPAAPEPIAIYTRVDPNLQQEDRDWTNNTAAFVILAPDLTVSEIGVQTAGPSRLITARVANEGVLTVTDVEVKLYAGETPTPPNPVLASWTVAELVPGAYHDVSYQLTLPTDPPGIGRTVCAIVDEANLIDELDEGNNTRSATAWIPPTGDMNCDGLVDFADINPFVLYLSNFAAWQATYAGCPPENGDINGDGLYPDFGDINPFVALLAGG